MAHYEERLQRDLDSIREQTAGLAADAERAVANSLQAVKTGNEKLAYMTILEDGKINRAHRELNKQCYRFIALHLPSAGPLRLIEAIVRTSIQLERLGDYAVTICREAIQMSRPPEGIVARELDMIGTDAVRMLNQAITAFNEGNEEMARTTKELASNVEHTLDAVYNDLTTEGDRQRITDMLATFVTFNMVKRISDQAKNICEEALFAVTGEHKRTKVHNILFVDQNGTSLAPMAEAIARKLYPDSAHFASAGRQPKAEIDPAIAEFMDQRGFDMSAIKPHELDPGPDNIGNYYVVVSLQGSAKSYIPKMPFHTAALDWDVGPDPVGLDGEEAASRLEELYREIVGQVSDLVETLTGTGSS